MGRSLVRNGTAQVVLVALAYAYLVSPVIGVVINRLRRKPPPAAEG